MQKSSNFFVYLFFKINFFIAEDTKKIDKKFRKKTQIFVFLRTIFYGQLPNLYGTLHKV